MNSVIHGLALLTLTLTACGSAKKSDPAPAAAPVPWTQAFDLDGDGQRDRIEVVFSGGAHCCYTVNAHLTSGLSVELPFELDGGYLGGLDLSQPERFAVRDATGDGLPDLVMEVGTYNGEKLPLPASWLAYGISGHRVIVSFADGELHVGG